MSAVQRLTTPKNKMTAYPTITVNEVRLHEFSVSPPSNAFSEEQAMNLLDDRRVKSVRPLIPYVPLLSTQEEGTLIRLVLVAPRFCRKSEPDSQVSYDRVSLTESDFADFRFL